MARRRWPDALISGYFRKGAVMRGATRLAMTPISPDLGWCEVPDDRNYNRPVAIPYAASHERMLRDDRSTISAWCSTGTSCRDAAGAAARSSFIWRAPASTPTQGCVAVTQAVMARLLPHLSSRTVLTVTR